MSQISAVGQKTFIVVDYCTLRWKLFGFFHEIVYLCKTCYIPY